MNQLLFIVDDISLMAELIQYNLELAGYKNTRVFDSPFKCLKEVRDHVCPALVISDFQMPRMNGFTLLQRVTTLYPSSKGIIVTDSPEDALQAESYFPVLRKGHAGFISELLRCICDALGDEYVEPAWRVALP